MRKFKHSIEGFQEDALAKFWYETVHSRGKDDQQAGSKSACLSRKKEPTIFSLGDAVGVPGALFQSRAIEHRDRTA